MNKKLFSILLVLLITIDTVPCKNLVSMADATITTITTDSEADLLNAVTKLNKNGGVIYINTAVIHISSKKTIQLTGTKSGGIVGMKQSNGAYPIIDFKKARNAGSTARGFTISGSNQYLKFLVVQKAGDNGIWVNGSKNTLDHIIARYNNDTGIQLSDNAASNTLNYCYSYRNIDVKTYGANADGFAPKLGATNTVFNYCFAWDNSDDGWDSYDKENTTKSNNENILSPNKNIDLKENEDMKEINSTENNKNQIDKFNVDDIKNSEQINLSPNSLLNRKTKPETELLNLQNVSNNNALNNNLIEPKKEYSSINNDITENKNVEEEYEYGYSIILKNEGETGLMEDFFKEKQNESTTSDYFNFHLDEEKWIKILNHSILIHYERNLKEEIEKRKKYQSMYMNNTNTISGNGQIIAPMNPMMIMNMPNGVNYQQMYLNNLKNMPMQYNFNK